MAKASDTEEEYFARENAERLRKLAAEQKKSLADSAKCGMELQEISVRGVQVDRCFACNGTFLDAGELEKLAGGQGENTVMSAVLRVFGGGKK
ncbi:MAG: hypothetical protein E6J82_10210 [Deltaproteobacteria bacterium]|nr:MAG: hypothetical protein E6J82_10210 [Deltaproteobacteria bacterium]